MKHVHLPLSVLGFQLKGASHRSVFFRGWIPTGTEIKGLENVCVGLCVPCFSFVCRNISDFLRKRAGAEAP